MSRPLKIVLVEDSPELVQSFQEFFELVDGHEVTSFLSGKLALAHPESIRNANLLISDYYLPDLNGMEIIQKAREINPTIPVILLSGAREPNVLATLRTMPRTKFLPKPVDLDDLETGIREMAAFGDEAVFGS